MTSTRKTDQEERTRRWAEAFCIGMAVAEGADSLDGADRIQILDAEGNVLFTKTIAREEVA